MKTNSWSGMLRTSCCLSITYTNLLPSFIKYINDMFLKVIKCWILMKFHILFGFISEKKFPMYMKFTAVCDWTSVVFGMQ